MRLLKVFIFLIFICFSLKSQNIQGIVKDKNTNELLIGATILLENGKGVSTDVNGKYIINTVEGSQKIIFDYIGYERLEKKINVKKGANTIINVSLISSSQELGTVVISAGRFEQKIEEITVSMEVIKPSLIENKNTTNIQTAMDQIPGVNITDGQANIRGGSGWSYGAGTRVLVMVDDMPLISGDAGQAQWSLIATENINQVEVIKGASSALYGSSALNGVINVRTAFPNQKEIDKNELPGFSKINMHFGLIDIPKRKELHWSGTASNQGGKLKFKRRSFKGIEFLHAMKLGNLDLSFGGNFFNDDGYRFGEKTDRKRFNFNSYYKSKKVEGLSFGLNGNFLVQNSGSSIIWNSLDSAFVPLGLDVINTEGLNYNIDPYATYIKGNNRHNLKTRYLSVFNKNLTNGQDAGQSNSCETYYSDYQWQKNIKKYNLIVTNGISFEHVIANSDLFSGQSERTNQSLYSQVDKKLGDFNFSFGARYESFQLESNDKYVVDGDSVRNFSANKPVFRTGLNYKIAKATYLRASWGQGYRFPAMSELFIATEVAKGIVVYPNPALKPEKGWSAEFGVKQGLKIGNWLSYLDVACFLMEYDDMMEFSFGQWGPNLNFIGFKSLNVGKTQISGIEFSFSGQGKINKNLTLNFLGGYTYLNPISLTPDVAYAIAGNGDEITYNSSSSDPSVLKYRYKNIAKLDLEIIYKKLSMGYSLRYNDFMKNIDYIFSDPYFNEVYVPGINDSREKAKNGDFIVDTRYAYKINDLFKLGFVINNLFNLEYTSRPANMMSPRTFAMQLAVKI